MPWGKGRWIRRSFFRKVRPLASFADALISIGTGTTTTTLSYIGTGNTTDRVINLPGTTGGAILDQSGASGLLKFTSDLTATGGGNKTLTLQGSTAGTGEIAGAIVDSSGFATAVAKAGSGTWTLSGVNTCTGTTAVNGGTLTLGFGAVASNILSTSSALTLGGGTLQLTGPGTQTVNGLTTTANTSSRILLGTAETLSLGALNAAGAGSSLNFNTAAGGANGATVGSGIVVLPGQTPGNVINSGFTVSDAGGFGLATVNGSDQVVRQTTGATLLPAAGATSANDYRVDNNPGGSAADGSSSLAITASEGTKSLTVDTTATSGILTLNTGVVLSNNIWNFGGTGSNTYQITGSAAGAGLKSIVTSDTISINNFNTGLVTIDSPILANGLNAVNLTGTGTTVFSGSNTYTGKSTVIAGTLRVTGGTSVIGVLSVGAAAYQQDSSSSVSSVTLTGTTEMNIGTTGTGTFTLSAGNFLVQTSSNAIAANIGAGGATTFNQTGGLFSFTPNGTNLLLNIGVSLTGSATVNLSGGIFQTAGNVPTYLGGRLPTEMNISGTALVDIPNLIFNRNLSTAHTATLNLGDGTPGSGTLKVSSMVKESTAANNVSIFNFNGGTLKAGATSASFMSGLSSANVKDGGAIIDSNAFDITIPQPLLHFAGASTDSLTKNGAGSLTLSGSNTYSGNTTVSAGTLTLSNALAPLNANTGNDASTVTIAATGATLDLTYSGTDMVAKLFIGVTRQPAGVYGKSGSVLPIIGIPQITGDGTLTVATGPLGVSFSSWITGTFANGTVPTGKQGPDDDPDNDGISNLLEYAVAGQDPTVGNPTIGTFTANTLSFTKRADATGLTYLIQESSDLGGADDWTEVSGGSYVNNATTISYTLTPATPVKNFVRLKVTQN